jgi:hypothetical protein
MGHWPEPVSGLRHAVDRIWSIIKAPDFVDFVMFVYGFSHRTPVLRGKAL